MALDLFGQWYPEVQLPNPSCEKPRRNETPRGYAGTPGKGPEGHFCKDCRHLVRKQMGKTYLKCWLMMKLWTGGPKTDIRANSPACEHWTPKQQLDPDVLQTQGQRAFYVKH